VSQAPDGAEWLHEIKFDGYRMHARVEGGRARLLTRTDLDWTSKYPAIADAATALPLGSAYTDGESCGVRADGITSFSLIQNASDTRNGEALVIFQFDLLHVDGEDPPLGRAQGELTSPEALSDNDRRSRQPPLSHFGRPSVAPSPAAQSPAGQHGA
jgi:ATP dependent DNA ligase domain